MTSVRSVAVLFSLFLVFPAAGHAQELNHAREYARCMGLAPSDPNDAFEMATAWKGLGGGDAAEHCAASASFLVK